MVGLVGDIEKLYCSVTAGISLLFFLLLYKGKKRKKKRVTTITVRATTYRNRWEKSSRFYLFVFSKQTCRLICSTPESKAKLGRKRAWNWPHPLLCSPAPQQAHPLALCWYKQHNSVTAYPISLSSNLHPLVPPPHTTQILFLPLP